MFFIDTEIDEKSKTHKTNRYEAMKLVEIIQSFKKLNHKNNLEMTTDSMGIITTISSANCANSTAINGRKNGDGLFDN